jgi:hypothetical protein
MIGFRFTAADTKQPPGAIDWIQRKRPPGELFQGALRLSGDPLKCNVDQSLDDYINYSFASPRQCQDMPDGLMGLEDFHGDLKGSPEYVHNIARQVC